MSSFFSANSLINEYTFHNTSAKPNNTVSARSVAGKKRATIPQMVLKSKDYASKNKNRDRLENRMFPASWNNVKYNKNYEQMGSDRITVYLQQDENI
jgi:hypothetical protein